MIIGCAIVFLVQLLMFAWTTTDRLIGGDKVGGAIGAGMFFLNAVGFTFAILARCG